MVLSGGSMQLHGRNLIAGELSEGGGPAFRAVEPASGRELEPSFHEASDAEVDRACRAAAQAFGDYRSRNPQDRAKFLREIASRIEVLGEELIERANRETAL